MSHGQPIICIYEFLRRVRDKLKSNVIDVFLDTEVAVSTLHYPLNTGPGHPTLRLSAHLHQYHVSETLLQLVSC